MFAERYTYCPWDKVHRSIQIFSHCIHLLENLWDSFQQRWSKDCQFKSSNKLKENHSKWHNWKLVQKYRNKFVVLNIDWRKHPNPTRCCFLNIESCLMRIILFLCSRMRLYHLSLLYHCRALKNLQSNLWLILDVLRVVGLNLLYKNHLLLWLERHLLQLLRTVQLSTMHLYIQWLINIQWAQVHQNLGYTW